MTHEENKEVSETTVPAIEEELPTEDQAIVEEEEPKHSSALIADVDEDELSDKRKVQYLHFSDAPLNPRVREVLKQINWNIPTPIQSKCLPFSLTGREVAGFAQTGTGKTGVFLITLAHKWLSKDLDRLPEEQRVCPFALVLAPTRELAMQIESDGKLFFDKLAIRSLSIFGGSDWEEQAKKLEAGVDVIVATPGRLKDFEQKGLIDLSKVQLFVCDEVDRMFEMGFIEDVEMVLGKLQDKAQKLIFSATTSPKVEELSFQYLNRPEYISINSEEIAPESIDQHAYLCETPDKFKLLLHLIKKNGPEQRSIVFANTKLTAAWIEEKLKGNGITSHLITGDLPQPKRTKLIQQIKEGSINLLIATDVASRGIHIPSLSHVYNFDVPEDAANYIHRIGRTARAGAKGTSYVFVCDEYGANYLEIQRLLFKDAPVPVWPPSEFAETEDLAGNPFEGNLSGLLRDSGRSDYRSSSSSSQNYNKDRDGRNQRFQDNKDRGPDRNRSSRPAQQQDHQAASATGERSNYQDRERTQQQPYQQKSSGSNRPAPAASGFSFLGLIKRLFALLFGFGKNKQGVNPAKRHDRHQNRSHQQDGGHRNQRHYNNRDRDQGGHRNNHDSNHQRRHHNNHNNHGGHHNSSNRGNSSHSQQRRNHPNQRGHRDYR